MLQNTLLEVFLRFFTPPTTSKPSLEAVRTIKIRTNIVEKIINKKYFSKQFPSFDDVIKDVKNLPFFRRNTKDMNVILFRRLGLLGAPLSNTL